MNRVSKVLLFLMGLGIAACGSQGGGTASNSSAALQQQQLQALNNLPAVEGEIDLVFTLVASVEEFFIIPYLPPILPVTDSPVTVGPPLPQNDVRVAGLANLELEDANGNPLIASIQDLPASAVFSGSTTTGTSCFATAKSAQQNNGRLEIRGQGVIVQIPYFYCPPGAMCAQPEAQSGTGFTAGSVSSPTDETASIVGDGLTFTGSGSPLPPWVYPHVGVYFRSLDLCSDDIPAS